ncbi:Three-deoxy-D-manno-octulosonic-acid transferase domain protein [Hymenobacter roseosalivarius DSM 11622]|uniref:3-deoxy-D-manno-octulosonic acid transferase n=1 Tax=Hymenobacter roseosalivarius DSM 11622 TaxID=645990 RepID=A0A1W1W3U7_9BACT|nr:glycosyltransferase N-terminal domain-containing protein [Hymenobacter roseosalivarius]SMC00297.1 Three-deoxy-D-manno-octulosonic-acid transferase domain protein [Hymenobacter roseosalivarius DSM 11622]
MLFLYTLALQSYALLLRLVASFVPKAEQWLSGRRGLLPHIQQTLKGETAPLVWFHCASLGEFEQGRPLMEAFLQEHPHFKLVLTFFSPSGYNVRKAWPGAHYVFYLPLDTAANARAFLDAVRPRLAVFVKYEFWYHFLTELQRRRVPVVCVSAIFRPQQVFFKPWGAFFRKIISRFTHIFTQNEASVELLRTIGIRQASVAGDTRFDTVVRTALASPRPLPLVEAFVADGAPVFIVGSNWPEDLPALTPLLRQYQDQMRFLFAPHEITETNLALVEAALPGRVVRYSTATPATVAQARVLLMDNVGLLSQLYRFGTYAYIGGAFGKGLHNTLEAAAFGLPLFFGPTYTKFQEAMDLVKAGCAFPIHSAAELQTAFGLLWHQSEVRLRVQDMSLEYVHQQAGATATIMAALARMDVVPVVNKI